MTDHEKIHRVVFNLTRDISAIIGLFLLTRSKGQTIDKMAAIVNAATNELDVINNAAIARTHLGVTQ